MSCGILLLEQYSLYFELVLCLDQIDAGISAL